MIVGGEFKHVTPVKEEIVAGIGLKVHFGHEVKRSPSHTELSAAVKREQAAKKQEIAAIMDQKIGDHHEKVTNWNSDIGRAVAKVGSLDSLVRGLSKHSASTFQWTAANYTIDADNLVLGKKKVTVYGTPQKFLVLLSPLTAVS